MRTLPLLWPDRHGSGATILGHLHVGLDSDEFRTGISEELQTAVHSLYQV